MTVEFAPIFELGLSEKLQLLEDLWDNIATQPANIPVLDWQKEELTKLILENQQKITHYKSLESQILSIDKDKQIILEEKQKLTIVKAKMAKNKREFDDEKLKFEIEKDRINDIDIDKFLNSELN